jgi:hypothetical protein
MAAKKRSGIPQYVHDAAKIAQLITKCNTDTRQTMYREIAAALRLQGQHYTAKGFDILAVLYEKGLY